MMPIGPLMIEHRLIERMIGLLATELQSVEKGKVDVSFIDSAVDFLRTYADRCHHGKEELILFVALEKKSLAPDMRKTLDELIREHVFARQNVRALIDARTAHSKGDDKAIYEVKLRLKNLVDLYPKHIEKEDKHFFIPSMDYFTKEERDEMLASFNEFDRKMIHEKYKTIVEAVEKAKAV